MNDFDIESFNYWFEILEEPDTVSRAIEACKKAGEEAFKKILKRYPHTVQCHLTLTNDEQDLRFVGEIEEREEWLKECIETEYVSFPTSATGQYKNYWTYVLFKNEEDAVHFKFVWV